MMNVTKQAIPASAPNKRLMYSIQVCNGLKIAYSCFVYFSQFDFSKLLFATKSFLATKSVSSLIMTCPLSYSFPGVKSSSFNSVGVI